MPISKRNRRGVFLLVILTIAIAYTPRIYSSLGDTHTFEVAIHELDQPALIAAHTELTETSKDRPAHNVNKPKYQVPQAKFDPNTLSLQEWMEMGLTEKQAAVVLKFTERGIRSNEELEKIVVIPELLFDLIKDSTVYPMKTDNYTHKKESRTNVISSIELNSATQEELESLPGIGPFYAKKIIEHREALGGYTNEGQLLEIWKFDDVRLAKIVEYLSVDQTSVQRLSVSQASFEALNKHPYISYNVANSIVKLRAQKPFESVEDIKRSALIDEELFHKLEPYLTR